MDFPEGKSLHDVTRDVARNLVIEALARSKTKQEAAALLGPLPATPWRTQIKILGVPE